MDIHLTLRKGPLEVEIEATDEDNYQEEVLSILEFLESHEEEIRSADSPVEDSEVEPSQASVTADWSEEAESSNSEEQEGTDATVETEIDESSPSSEFASQLNVNPDQLIEVLDIDPELEEPPFIATDTTGFGESRQDRQLHGTLVLLGTWQECYGAERVSSSDLKDALDFSGINPDELSSMYHNIDEADSFFDRSGRGRSATIALTRPGLREAQGRIRELVED